MGRDKFRVLFILVTILTLVCYLVVFGGDKVSTSVLFGDENSSDTRNLEILCSQRANQDNLRNDHSQNIQLKYENKNHNDNDENNSSVISALEPQRHIYYLKTHKTGSTTISTILTELTQIHNLVPLLPRDGVYFNGYTDKLKDRPPNLAVSLIPNITKYDIVLGHHIYTERMFQYLHKDSFKFSTLREPYSQFKSAVNYFKLFGNGAYLKRLKGPDIVLELLQNQDMEEHGYASFTNNRQSVDLGYDIRNHNFTDEKYIKEFIKTTEQRFDFIAITEYFDESLILLKRKLRWTMHDILYLKLNQISVRLAEFKTTSNTSVTENNETTTTNSNSSNNDSEKRKLHDKYHKADIALYNHFLGVFKEQMGK